MPLYRRVPKRGFTNIFRTKFAVINVGDLEVLKLTEISLENLREAGALRARKGRSVKILGNGELKRELKVKAHAVSLSAKEKIEKAGGSVEIIA